MPTGSDTGRDTGSTTTDNITALSHPVVIVTGGTIGSVISLWSDAGHTQLLGRGQVEALSNIAGDNGARITLSDTLQSGGNTLYATVLDQAGNKSVGDKSLQVTYLKPIDGNTPLKLNISSTAPAVSKGFYKVGDVIEVSVDFGRDVFLKQGKVSSQLAVQLVPAKADGAPQPTPNEIAKALYIGGLGGPILKFKYTVEQDIDRGALNSVFTAAALLNADQVLEDVAGSTVIGKFIAVDGQSLKIDTIAPLAPTVVLPAGLPMTDGQPTFSLDAATNRGFTVKAEAGSTISIKVKNINNLTGSGYTKTVIATGAEQIITPTAAELAGITGSVFQVTATATDAAGNISAQSVAQTFVLDVRAPVASAVSSSLNSVTNQPFDFKVSFDEALTPPSGMTNFAEPAPALVTDSSYSGRGGDDPLRVPATQGDRDKVTQDGSLRVRLTKALSGDERLQFAVATAADVNGQPLFGSWKEAGKLTQGGSNARGEVDYIASDVASTTGSNWVKARVVQVGASYTGGYGNANTGAETLQFTLDTVAPARPALQFVAGKDDGLSSSDGVSRQPGAQLSVPGMMEGGTELHFRLASGNGTDARTLQLLPVSGAAQDIKPDTWYRLKAGERLQLNGDTITGNGKAQIDLRQIDVAGNFSESTQRFVVDSSGLIEHTVLLASSEKAVNDARSAVAVAQAVFDAADALSRSAKQAALATAQAALTRAQTAEDNAMAQARAALVNADGSTRLDSVMATPVDKNYVPAIINAVAATADPDQVSDALSLKAVVSAAIKAADAAVTVATLSRSRGFLPISAELMSPLMFSS